MVGYTENGNPKRKTITAATKKEALDLARELMVRVKGGDRSVLAKGCRMDAWLDEWLDTYVKPNRAPKTYDYYEGFVRNHIKPAFGGVLIRELEVYHVQQLINAKRTDGKSFEFLRGLRATIRASLARAVKLGHVLDNVATKVDMPRAVKRTPEHLSPDQVSKFLAAIEGSDYEHVMTLAIFTGLRIGEITGLRWRDVNFDTNQIRIACQLQRIDGILRLCPLKTGSSLRTLPMSATIRNLLEAQREWLSSVSASGVAKRTPELIDLVFVHANGRPFDPKTLNDALKRSLSDAGLPEVSFHKLRHTFATLTASRGDLHAVKQILGHGQIALTANLYAHAMDEAKSKAMESFEEVLQVAKNRAVPATAPAIPHRPNRRDI